MTTLSYNEKTEPDEILKRIAVFSYDSDNFHASKTDISKLTSCFQYDREVKVITKMVGNKVESSNIMTVNKKQISSYRYLIDISNLKK